LGCSKRPDLNQQTNLSQTAMSEKLHLSIADPCHEDWNKMTPVEQGRFCSSCQKNVVDFTAQSDEEIISFFNNYNGSACGRFTDDQLDRPIQKIELKPASRFLKYAASLLLPVSLFSTKANAQKEIKSLKIASLSKANIDERLFQTMGFMSVDVHSILSIKGKVINEQTKEPIAGVSVMIKGAIQGVITDTIGNFSIQMSARQRTLQYSSIGYESTEVRVSESSENLRIEMKQSTKVMDEIIVVGYATRRMGGLYVTRFDRIPVWNKIKDTLLPAKINVYPNPVAASGTINISFPNVKPGQYQIRMLNAAGQLFYSFQKQISGKGEAEQIHLTNTMTPGMYMLQVLDEKKKLIQTTKLSVQ
jgi:hypothetical protein